MKRGFADTPEGQVHYVTAGQGEPLVLLHKSPRSHRMYLKLIPLLAEHYQVFALDMLGYGFSDPSPAEGDVLAGLARSIVHVLDALGIEKTHLYGIHTGSAVAAEVAAGWPDRIATLIVFSLPMLDAEAREGMGKMHSSFGGYTSWTSQADGTHLMRLWIRAMDDIHRLLMHTAQPPPDFKRNIENLKSDAYLPNPARASHLWMQDPDYLRYLDGWVMEALLAADAQGRGGSVYGSLYGRDPMDSLPRIKAPTLHIEPDTPYEAFFTSRGPMVAEMIPNCELTVLENADDNVHYFNPPILAEVIVNYLQKHPI